MSLNLAITAAKYGLAQAEKKIAIVSSNINNADRPGYTRKVLENKYASAGFISLPIGGVAVQAIKDNLLVRQVNEQSTVASNQGVLADYLSRYSQSFGGTGADATTLSSTLDTLNSTMQILVQNPSDSSAKSKVITTAQTVASSLNNLSHTVQDARLRANNEIGTKVTEIAQNLKSIYDLNKQIASAISTGASTADLEDSRNVALLSLSQKIGVQYFTNDQNQVLVYTPGGTSLVGGTQFASFSYSPVGQVTSATVYPGGFGGIMMNGIDITNSISGGELGALITLRDNTLPDEQEKLDALATTLTSSVNAALNQGTAYPPLNSVTGSVDVISGTALSGTGTLRVAVTNQSGVIQNVATLNMASYATVGALVTALNAIPGVTASVATGKLVITANSASNGISLNPQDTNIGGVSATQFFGFNDLFVHSSGTTINAASIRVSSILTANPGALACGTLSTTATSGTAGITSGDGSTAQTLVSTLNSAQSFVAAGNFSSRTATLSNYAGAIISDIATQSAAATLNSDTASASYRYLSDSLSNETGVNVDEETANLTVLQGSFQANAQLIATVRDLFSTLISAMR